MSENSEFRLSDEHLVQAKRIAANHSRRSSCKVCFGRGWEGVSPADNTVVLCRKCVDQEGAIKEWREYVEKIPELWDYYKDMYEEADAAQAKAEAEAAEDESAETKA